MSTVKLVEATIDNKKTYKFSGVFATIGQKNQNGRVYPRELWIREVNRYQEEIKNNTINTLMEWEHPEGDRVEVLPQNAVAKINKLWISEDKVYGEAIVLDGQQTEILKSLIDNGVQISVSSRSVGDLDNYGNVKDFKLITFDIVGYPSDRNATMTGIYESFQKYNQFLKESQQKKNQGEISFLKKQIEILKEKNEEVTKLLNAKEQKMSYAEKSRKLRKALNESYDDYNLFDDYEDYDYEDYDDFEDDDEFFEARRRSVRPTRRRFFEEDEDDDEFFEARRRSVRPTRRRFFEENEDDDEDCLEERRRNRLSPRGRIFESRRKLAILKGRRNRI